MQTDNNQTAHKYQLCLLALNQENIELAVKQRFNRITSKYILIYAENAEDMVQNCRYHIIDENETGHLSDSEKVWLLEANMKIIAEESEKQQAEIIRRFEERISILERELEKEAENLREQSEDDSDNDEH